MLPTHDTIAAIATPPFRGGIGVIRISGPDALMIAGKIFSGSRPPAGAESHRALFGYAVDPDTGDRLDEGLCTVMRAPNSYTGEHVAELSLHGSPLLLHRVLDFAFRQGARQAEPGEFTFRAYMNGRLALTEAEAVHQLIEARSGAGLRNAFLQLGGSLQTAVTEIRDDILELSANFEAEIEFPEEGLNFVSREEAAARVSALGEKIANLRDTYPLGRAIEEGLKIVICGPPNSGKSTLLNRLTNEERAIVHPLPGTTRDAIEGFITVNGAAIRLVDTAGIRERSETIEEEGIRRTFRNIGDADFVLWVQSVENGIPNAVAHPAELQKHREEGAVLIALNKADLIAERERNLPESIDSSHAVLLSAKEGWGIDRIREALSERLTAFDTGGHEGKIVTSARQHQLLQTAHEALHRAGTALDGGVSAEYVMVDINESAEALDELTGVKPRENIYDVLFSKFCLGK